MSKGLVHALCRELGAELIETHISWLVMGQETVLKLKKPLDLGFLDFSTLEARRHCCEEEVRLNRRTAPSLYLGVVTISGTEDSPRLDDDSGPIDYAVRMRRFDDSALLDRLATAGEINDQLVDEMAAVIASFHEQIHGAMPPDGFGTPASIRAPVQENFDDLDALDHHDSDRALLDELSAWVDAEFESRCHDFDVRREQGFVRECHGDLHLGNLFFDGEHVVPFDCIEFSESLRWIDVAADIAFTIMDLMNHGLPALGHRLLNEYLAHTGDFGMLGVLDWYLVYRAMVRAKVAAIRADQDHEHEGELAGQCSHYLALAASLAAARRPALVLMSGLSGTGKTTIARDLAGTIGAIHVRSDVERKRLYGVGIHASSRDAGVDIYTRLASERTFSRLEELASQVIESGRAVVVDATFIESYVRDRFTSLADRIGVPWAIVECTASEQIVRDRLEARSGDASEAGMQQYFSQRDAFEAFSDRERARTVVVDTEHEDGDAAAARLQAMWPQ